MSSHGLFQRAQKRPGPSGRIRRLRSSPTRVQLIDVGPPISERVSVDDAMTEVRERGIASVVSADLEVYRLVMSPVEFKRLCNRLDRELAAFHQQQNHASWSDVALPFGADIEADVRRERLESWGDRPNGEPFPLSWTVESECQIPGRLKLVVGREFTVRGVRGRLRFRHAVRTDAGEWWVEGWDLDGRCRSVDPSRVRVVHAKSKVRPWNERLTR